MYVMSFMFRTFTVLIFFCLTSTSIMADIIRLNGGQVIEGEVLSESDKILVIRTTSGDLTIRKEDILERQRPGQKAFPRPPESIPDPVVSAAKSFIPFYSGFYETEDEEFGVLPATIAGFYALAMIDTMPGLRFEKGWSDSNFIFGGNPVEFGGSRPSATTFVFLNRLAFTQNSLSNEGLIESYFYSRFLTESDDRFFPVKGTITGSTRSRADMNNNFNNALRGYVISSIIHSALVYWHVSENGGGSIYANNDEGFAKGNIHAYILPTGGSDFQFGMMMSF